MELKHADVVVESLRVEDQAPSLLGLLGVQEYVPEEETFTRWLLNRPPLSYDPLFQQLGQKFVFHFACCEPYLVLDWSVSLNLVPKATCKRTYLEPPAYISAEGKGCRPDLGRVELETLGRIISSSSAINVSFVMFWAFQINGAWEIAMPVGTDESVIGWKFPMYSMSWVLLLCFVMAAMRSSGTKQSA